MSTPDTCTVTVTIEITSPADRQDTYQEEWTLEECDIPAADGLDEEDVDDFLIGYAHFDKYPVWFNVTVDSVSDPRWDYLIGWYARGAK